MSKFLQNVEAASITADAPGRLILLGFDRQPLRDADGASSFIDLYSADSDAARKHTRRVTDRRLAMKGRGKITAAEIEADAVELLVAVTAGWGTIAKDGTATPDVDFSAAAARELYADPKNAEIRAQVDEFIADRGNFSKALSISSLNSQSTRSDKAAG